MEGLAGRQTLFPAHISPLNFDLQRMVEDQLLPVVLVVCVVVVVTAIAASLLLIWILRQNTTTILFIDAPDPDNPAAAMALWRYVLRKKGRLRIVLTGRPVNLRTTKRFSERVLVKEQIARQKWEVNVPGHALRVLEDSAARVANYLERCGVPSNSFTIYDGGVAREAPLSDIAHDWDFLFDRKDLVTQKDEDKGEMLDPSEYKELVAKYCGFSEAEREQTFLATLRRYDLTPLEKLRTDIGRVWTGRVAVFLGGPATALVRLFVGRTHLCNKVTSFYAMFGSLHPGKTTLLANQFNAACDLQAAREVFVDGMFRQVRAHLVTTETSKLPTFLLSAQEMQERGMPEHVVKLQRLWELTHGDRPQPMFDVLPVMASLPAHRDCFTWCEKKAVLIKACAGDQEVFSLKDVEAEEEESDTSNSSTVLVSNDYSMYDKESFVQFFVRIWK